MYILKQLTMKYKPESHNLNVLFLLFLLAGIVRHVSAQDECENVSYSNTVTAMWYKEMWQKDDEDIYR